MVCTYSFRGPDGKRVTLVGQAAMKAYLADGGMAEIRRYSLPDKRDFEWEDSFRTSDGGLRFSNEHFSFVPAFKVTQGESDFDTGGFAQNGLMGHRSWATPNSETWAYGVTDRGGAQPLATIVMDIADGKPAAIHDIEVYGKGRGVGARIVASLAANTNSPIQVVDILDQSQNFWEKLGATRDFNGNGQLDWQTAAAELGRRPRRNAAQDVASPAHEGKDQQEGLGYSEVGDEITLFSPQRWYYSQLERAVEQAPEKVFGPAPQVKAWLLSNAAKLGIKQDEIQWTGITDWLDAQGKSRVTKEKVSAYLARNGVQGLPLFSLKRARNGDFNENAHVVPEISPWIDNSQLVDLAYINGKPIRLNVGKDAGPGRGFGAVHIAETELREPRRSVEKDTDDRGENIARSVFKALATAGAVLHKDGNKFALRLPLAGKTLILADNKDHYSVVTVLPSAKNKWGNADWTGRLTFPATADATSAEPLSPPGAESSLASRSGMGSYESATFDIKAPYGFNQATTLAVVRSPQVTYKKQRAIDPETKRSRSRIVGQSSRQYSKDQLDFFQHTGRTIDEKSLVEKLVDFRKDFAKKMAVGIVDQFRGLKDLGTGGLQAYLLSRLSKGTAGAFEALLNHGKLSLRDGVYDADQSGGVLEKLFMPLQGEGEDFLWWVAANRAERLKAETARAHEKAAALREESNALMLEADGLESKAKEMLQQAGNFAKSMTGTQAAQKENAREAERLQRQARALRGEASALRKEAVELAAVNRERLFTVDDIAAGKSLDNDVTKFDYTLQHGANAGQVTRDRTLIYRDALKTLDAFNKNVLDMAEQSGLIDGEARHLWEHEFYVPFYRVSEEDGEFIGAKIGNQLVRQKAFEKLRGGTDKLNSDLLANTLQNWAHLIDAAAKNRAAKASLVAAEKSGVAHLATPGEKNTVWYAENGQKVEYKVEDPFVMTAITSLEYAGMRNGIMTVLSKFKHWLTVGVTANPAFKVRNLIRDSIQAIGTSDLSYNVIGNLKEGWKATNRESQDYVSALASGGLIRFGTMLEGKESDRVRQLVKSGVKDAQILNSDEKLKAFYDRYLEPAIAAYNEIGNRGEEINRAALYKQLIAQGKSHAEAALLARDLMDFSMQGSFNTIRFLTQVVPFLNARLQGLYKLGRAAQEEPAKMAIVTGAVALASIALLLAYRDDDDWKKREDWDRNSNWWFKIGGIGFYIPKPFELGAIATLAERSVELMVDDEMTGKRFAQNVRALLQENLAMNPVPQLMKPLIDLYANKDSFTGRPIETMGMEKLEPQYRFKADTSMVSRGLSTATFGAISPVQYDHLIRGYFSWLGSFVVGGADIAIRAMSDEPTRPALDYWKFATQGMAKSLDSVGSRYVSQMYDEAKELEQYYGTWKRLQKDGKVSDAKEYLADHGDEIKRYHQVESVKKAEALSNQQIHRIEISDRDPDEKRRLINEIRARQDRIARKVAPGYQSQQ